MKQYIFYGEYILSGAAVLAGSIVMFFRFRNENTGRKTCSPLAPFIALIDYIVFFLIGLLFDASGIDGFYLAELAVFLMLSALLSLFYIFEYLEYDSVGFTKRSFLGIKRHFLFRDITSIRKEGNGITLFFGKRRVQVDKLLDEREFAFAANTGYAKYHGRNIPLHDESKTLFGEHVIHSAAVSFVIVYLLALLLLLYLGIELHFYFESSAGIDIFFAAFLLLWLVYGEEAVRVARHPEKVSKKYRKMFFREDDWK